MFLVKNITYDIMIIVGKIWNIIEDIMMLFLTTYPHFSD